MSSGVGATCLNHPGFEAVGRCKQCGIPFCSKCRVQGATGNFCSDSCKEKHGKFTERAERMGDGTPKGPGIIRRVKGMVARLVIIALVCLLIAVALAFFGMEIPVVSDLVERVLSG